MIHIIPHCGIGLIRFGMTRSEVEQAIGRTPLRRRRNEFELSDHDYFEGQGLFVYYDLEGKCNAAELTCKSSAEYEGVSLFSTPASRIREWARQRDANLECKDGFVSRLLGLSMYAPTIDEPDLDEDEFNAPAQSFLVFKPGIY
jgi:hypothetical protein